MKESHSIFVTGLSFAHRHMVEAMGKNDFSLLSISADSQVKLHQAPPPCESRGFLFLLLLLFLLLFALVSAIYSIFWPIIGAAAIVYLIFWFLTLFQLL